MKQKGAKMETVTIRIDKRLLKEIQDWLDKNGNKYKHPSVTAFVNSAIYEKLKSIKKVKE